MEGNGTEGVGAVRFVRECITTHGFGPRFSIGPDCVGAGVLARFVFCPMGDKTSPPTHSRELPRLPRPGRFETFEYRSERIMTIA